jgi:hypothetical protein
VLLHVPITLDTVLERGPGLKSWSNDLAICIYSGRGRFSGLSLSPKSGYSETSGYFSLSIETNVEMVFGLDQFR